MLKIGKKWYFKEKSAISDKIDECIAPNDCANLKTKNIRHCKEYTRSFEYRCLKQVDVEHLLNRTISNLSSKLHITPLLAKLLLRSDGWKAQGVITKYQENYDTLPIKNKIKSTAVIATAAWRSNEETCSVCLISLPKDNFDGLVCSHMFCKECWRVNIEIKVSEGNSSVMCMENNCEVVALEDFILKHLTVDKLRFRYQQFIFQNFVVCHPQLRFCPGPDCTVIIQSKCWKPKSPIKCYECKTTFCFKCGTNYHAPTDYKTYRKRFTQTEMQGLTKDFSQCRRRETMKCTNCNYSDLSKNHDSTSGMSTRYNKNKNVKEEVTTKQTTSLSLRRYNKKLKNHSKSLDLVKKAYNKLTLRIKQKTGHGCIYWIEWQDIYPVLKLLIKCLNTLKCSYLKVFRKNADLEKYLFHCRQKVLQRKLNKLTRKIEKAEANDIAELQHQVMVCEEYRKSLL